MENHRSLLHVSTSSLTSQASRREPSSRKQQLKIDRSCRVSLQRFGRMQFPLERRLLASLCAIFFLASSFFLAAADRRELQDHFASSTLISDSDLQNRHTLEQSIQVAAFEQFDRHKTGRIYNVSVTAAGVPSGSTFQAIRLRAGSFRKYGVVLKEFSIPKGCVVTPAPERILLVYASLVNSSLFQDLPGYDLAAPVVSVFAYDASDLNTSQPLSKLSVVATSSLISIDFQPFSSEHATLSCVSFADNSTNTTITNTASPNVCNASQFGTFSLVSIAPTVAPSPSPVTSQVMVAQPPGKSSKTVKVAVGSVVGGLAVLALLSLLAYGAVKHRKNAKFAMMEHHADQGETLQRTSIRNSRAPAAGSTRTQPTLESEYVA